MSYGSRSPRLARLEVEDLDTDGNYLGKPIEAEVCFSMLAWAALTDSAPLNADHLVYSAVHLKALRIVMIAYQLFQAQPTPYQ